MNIETTIRFFQDGGIFMFPIAAILIVGVAIVVERFVFLAAAKKSNREIFDRILPMLQKRDYQGAPCERDVRIASHRRRFRP